MDPRIDKFETYLDEAGEHRWRLTAPNGENRNSSDEGFKNLEDCESNAKLTGENLYKIFHPETII